MPSVIALKEFLDLERPAAFTRLNLLLRDARPEGFACAYCRRIKRSSDLTFDHVLPKSRGGRSSFTNVAAACRPCNAFKANLTPDEARMPLAGELRHPTIAELNRKGEWFLPSLTDDASTPWAGYWNVELFA